MYNFKIHLIAFLVLCFLRVVYNFKTLEKLVDYDDDDDKEKAKATVCYLGKLIFGSLRVFITLECVVWFNYLLFFAEVYPWQ